MFCSVLKERTVKLTKWNFITILWKNLVAGDSFHFYENNEGSQHSPPQETATDLQLEEGNFIFLGSVLDGETHAPAFTRMNIAHLNFWSNKFYFESNHYTNFMRGGMGLNAPVSWKWQYTQLQIKGSVRAIKNVQVASRS